VTRCLQARIGAAEASTLRNRHVGVVSTGWCWQLNGIGRLLRLIASSGDAALNAGSTGTEAGLGSALAVGHIDAGTRVGCVVDASLHLGERYSC
jgi:hypothetical protein